MRAALEAAIIATVGGNDIIVAFERVHLLADEAGDRAIHAVGDERLRAVLAVLGNACERALRLLEEDERLFAQAEEIRYADVHAGAGRRWTGFLGPRGRAPSLDGTCVAPFKERVATAFRGFDGSGSSVEVEHFERDQPGAARQRPGAPARGLPRGAAGHLDELHDGRLVRRGLRPAKELVLTHAPETGAIDVVSHAGSELRLAVAKAFAACCFGSDGRLEPVRLRQVDLSGLRRPPSFPTDPSDGIRAVRLLQARVVMPGEFGRATLEIGRRSSVTLHEAAERWFGPRNPFHDGLAINRVQILIEFEPGAASGRARRCGSTSPTRTVAPCATRSEHERLIGEKYLRRWGLVRGLGMPAPDPVDLIVRLSGNLGEVLTERRLAEFGDAGFLVRSIGALEPAENRPSVSCVSCRPGPRGRARVRSRGHRYYCGSVGFRQIDPADIVSFRLDLRWLLRRLADGLRVRRPRGGNRVPGVLWDLVTRTLGDRRWSAFLARAADLHVIPIHDALRTLGGKLPGLVLAAPPARPGPCPLPHGHRFLPLGDVLQARGDALEIVPEVVLAALRDRRTGQPKRGRGRPTSRGIVLRAFADRRRAGLTPPGVRAEAAQIGTASRDSTLNSGVRPSGRSRTSSGATSRVALHRPRPTK